MREWTRQFSLPDGPPDEAVFETILSAHGAAVVSQLIERHGRQIAEASQGLVESLGAWAESPRGERTAWHLSFGRAQLMLKEGKLDPVEAAVRVGLRIASEGEPGKWHATMSPMTVQIDERFAENVTGAHVENAETGACSITLQFAHGGEAVWRRSAGEREWNGDGGALLQRTGRNRRVLLVPRTALPPEDCGGEVFRECNPVSEIGAEIAQSFQDGFEALEKNAPQYIPWVERVLGGIVVASRQAEYRLVSGSWEDVPGFVHISSPHRSIDIAEILVHESAHQYFYMLQRVGPMDDATDQKQYWSPPIRKSRPLSRILMAYHALANVWLLYQAVRADATNDAWDMEYVRINEPDLEAALRALDAPLRDNPALTAFGRGLYHPVAERLASMGAPISAIPSSAAASSV